MSQFVQRRKLYKLLIGLAVIALVCDFYAIDVRRVNKLIQNTYVLISIVFFVSMLFLFIKETLSTNSSSINKLTHVLLFLVLDTLVLIWFIALSGVLDTNFDY